MKGLFNYDGAATNFFGKVADCLILSVLWLLFSLPIFTIGASSTALYYTANKNLRGDEGGIWKNFWNSFRANFKQSTTVWLIVLFIYYLLGLSIYSAYTLFLLNQIPVMVLIALTLIITGVTMWVLYIFPCVARFENGTLNLLKASAGIAAFNLSYSLILLLIFAATVGLTVILPVGLLIMPAAGTWLSSFILEKVFKKYI